MDYLYDNNEAEEWGRYNWQSPLPPPIVQPNSAEEFRQTSRPENPQTEHGYWTEYGYLPTNNPAGTMDLAYWQSRDDQLGGNTAVDDIFDVNTGQLKSGWQRTINGYERIPTAAHPETTTDPNVRPRNQPTVYETGFTKSPLANVGPAPSFPGGTGIVNHPAFKGPDPFKAPSAADMLKDPGFDFRRQMGEDAIKRNAAAMGKLRTGGTYKGLIDYNQNFASLEYGNVYERAANEYDRLYNNMMGEYKLGYQQQLDRGDQDFRLASAQFAPRLREWEVGAQAAQRAAELEYLREQDVWETIYNAGAD